VQLPDISHHDVSWRSRRVAGQVESRHVSGSGPRSAGSLRPLLLRSQYLRNTNTISPPPGKRDLRAATFVHSYPDARIKLKRRQAHQQHAATASEILSPDFYVRRMTTSFCNRAASTELSLAGKISWLLRLQTFLDFAPRGSALPESEVFRLGLAESPSRPAAQWRNGQFEQPLPWTAATDCFRSHSAGSHAGAADAPKRSELSRRQPFCTFPTASGSSALLSLNTRACKADAASSGTIASKLRPRVGTNLSFRRPFTCTQATMVATKIDGTAIAKAIRAKLKADILGKQKSNPRFLPSLKIIQGKSSHVDNLPDLLNTNKTYSR
jgi:hypothetical protein